MRAAARLANASACVFCLRGTWDNFLKEKRDMSCFALKKRQPLRLSNFVDSRELAYNQLLVSEDV